MLMILFVLLVISNSGKVSEHFQQIKINIHFMENNGVLFH